MGVFDKLERGLERAVRSPFARVFKAEVQPVEIASEIRKSMDDRAAVLGPGRTMVPNVFTVELAESDHERLSSYQRALTDELVASAEDHADAQRYLAPGPFEVELVSGDDLETGIFRVRPAAKDGRGHAHQLGGGASPAPRAGARAGARREDRHDDVHERPSDRYRDARDDQDELAAYRRPSDGDDRGPVGDDAFAPRRPAGQLGGTRAVPVGGDSAPEPRERRTRGPVLEVEGRRVPLTRAATSIGRDEACDLRIDDPGASRRHAEVRITHDGPHQQVILRDLGSTNGTFLNGEQVGTEELRDGDRITMGRTHLVYREG